MTNRTEEILEYFKEAKPQATIDGMTFWLVEGDLLMTEDDLWAYAIERAILEAEDGDVIREGLIAAEENGRVIRWHLGKILTYCVRRSTFVNDLEYQTVVDNLSLAAAAWESVCGVRFRHLIEYDLAEPAGAKTVLFDVIYTLVNAQNYIATAFFPYTQAEKRHLRVYPLYFTKHGYDPIGVFRHELGHVLGFRHEHIRAPQVMDCGDELPGVHRTLTPYDSKSVMHYLCKNHVGGNLQLAITETDREGAQRVYGLPYHEVDERD